MAIELPPRYQPAEVESRMYTAWEAEGRFRADPNSTRPPYCIMIPPPNVTDRLHLGHALNNTLQDVLIRFHRMRQDNTLWMPGTDHAGIATQTVVEKRILKEEGKRRTDFERADFVARIQAWKDEYEATITRQLKLMGCSCDWERQRFTMDEVCARAVREAFFRLFKDGLIYRGKRLVNWDPATQTVLADDEVEHEEVRGHFWYMRYPLVEAVESGGGRIEHVTVATTRPETMLGDTAVAMHPSDPRAGALVGKFVRLPIVGRVIPIIADEHVVLPNPESEDEKARFSTGFLKVTPAHDPDDYAIGQRHGLPIVNVLAPDGSISDKHGWTDATTPEAQNLIGMDRFEAREAVVEFFRQEGLLEEVRDYVHQVGHSYRSHVPIEPYLSDQWYIAVKKPIPNCRLRIADCGLKEKGLVEVRGDVEYIRGTDVPVNSLAGLALAPLLDGRVKFTPDRYAKTYQAWIENLRDWPISRQLWWGHQIPVWYVTLEYSAVYPPPVGRVQKTQEEIETDFRESLDALIRKAGLVNDIILQPCGPVVFFICSLSLRADDLLKDLGLVHDGLRLKPVRHGVPIQYAPAELPHFPACTNEAYDVAGKLLYYHQDPDVLDTWFSSALWPFSTLGWPEQTPLLRTFYPGNLLCTAREIITLWVSRMVMMGQYCVGDIPFPDVFIHAMIQDGEGRKMSKSLGNGIDPLDIIDTHGADAMRFTLVSMTTQTQDVRMPVEQLKLADGRTVNTSGKFDNGRNFCNKLWNAARFALMNLEGGAPAVSPDDLPFEDRWILSRRNRIIEAVTEALAAYRFNDAAQVLYDFTWHEFCDWYVEVVKPRLGGVAAGGQAPSHDSGQAPRQDSGQALRQDSGQALRQDSGQAKAVLAFVLDTVLRLLHPLMPFITEELWGHLGAVVPVRGVGQGGVVSGRAVVSKRAAAADRVIVAEWPQPIPALDSPKLEADMSSVQDIVRAIRNIRSKLNIGARRPLAAFVVSGDGAVRAAVEENRALISHLSSLSELSVTAAMARPGNAAAEVVGRAEVFVPLEGLIDVGAERARLEKQLADVRGKLGSIERKLGNEGFVAKAPATVVERERAKAADLRAQAEKLERNLAELS